MRLNLNLSPNEFWISNNTPSSKNRKIWTGSFLVHGKSTARWLRDTKEEWKDQRLRFISQLHGLTTPYYIELTFVRKSKHRWDYLNASQIVFDTMKDYGWIEDDNADNVKPYFGDYIYDKLNPGVKITILKIKPIHHVHL